VVANKLYKFIDVQPISIVGVSATFAAVFGTTVRLVLPQQTVSNHRCEEVGRTVVPKRL